MNEYLASVLILLAAIYGFCAGMLYSSRRVLFWKLQWIEVEHKLAYRQDRNPRTVDEIMRRSTFFQALRRWFPRWSQPAPALPHTLPAAAADHVRTCLIPPAGLAVPCHSPMGAQPGMGSAPLPTASPPSSESAPEAQEHVQWPFQSPLSDAPWQPGAPVPPHLANRPPFQSAALVGHQADCARQDPCPRQEVSSWDGDVPSMACLRCLSRRAELPPQS